MSDQENVKIINVFPRKRRKSECSNPQFKTEVSRVYKYLDNIKTILKDEKLHNIIDLCELNHIGKTVGELFQITKRSVYNILNSEPGNAEEKENSTPTTTLEKRTNSSKFQCDEFLVAMIRRVLQGFYSNKQYPDIRTILAKCKEDINFPPISESTLQRWLKHHCKMKYRKINKKPVYLERGDIKVQRETYLRKIRKYRKENYTIFYSDETWTSPDLTRNRCWQTFLNDTEYNSLFKNNFPGPVLRDMNGWTGGFLGKSAAGRIIVNHIGSTDGFLTGGEDVFISKKDTKDYHGTMDFDRYRNWFLKVLQLVPDMSVLVLDQAPYHRKRVESTINPTTTWRKAKLIEWLQAMDVPLPNDIPNFNQLTRPELLKLAKENPVKTKFIVEELAETCGKDVKVLWLPVAHCEFNPIELIWSQVKGYVAKKNTGKNIKEMLDLTNEALDTITPNLWEKCVKHVIKYEDKMWQRDRIIEEDLFGGNINQIIINVQDEGDTTSSDDSDSDWENFQ